MSADLPDLLAGPVLRRLTTDVAYIWFAFSRRVEVEIEVTESRGSHSLPNTSGRSDAPTFSRGRLHTYLVRVPRSAPTLQGNGLPELRYRVFVVVDGTRRQLDLSNLAPVSKEDGPVAYPSLGDKSDIWFASCRKLTGLGQDAGVVLWQEYSAVASSRRAARQSADQNPPGALLLLGDQVYVDDVADWAYEIVCKCVGLIFPRATPATRANRLAALRKAGLLGAPRSNVLVTFEEISVLYLLHWGTALWKHAVGTARLKPTPGVNDSATLALQDAYRGTQAWERILACTPSYMGLDDHEFLDDWNMLDGWRERITSDTSGTEFVVGALGAHLIFQALGNDPENPTFGSLASMLGQHNGGKSESQSLARKLLEPGLFSLVVPTAPPILLLDTRTAREPSRVTFEINARAGAVARSPTQKLVTFSHASAMLSALDRTSDEAVPIVCLATPLVGHWPIEQRKQLLAGRRTTERAEALDLEGWHDNLDGLLEFLDALKLNLRARRVVVLSGDVHYAFGAQASFRWREDGYCLEVLQCTSSPSRNFELSAVAGSMFLNADSRTTHYQRISPSAVAFEVGDSCSLKGAVLSETVRTYSLGSGKPSGSSPTVITANNVGVLRRDRDVVSFRLLSGSGTRSIDRTAWMTFGS